MDFASYQGADCIQVVATLSINRRDSKCKKEVGGLVWDNCSLLSTLPDLGAIPADSVIFHEQTWGRKEEGRAKWIGRERGPSIQSSSMDWLRWRDDE